MYVDASAIVAILTREPDADALADALDAARLPITSAVAVFEAVLGLCRKRHVSVAEAQEDVQELLEAASIRVVSITGKEAETALDAFARYGKGRGHPAQLNMVDCFAYAVAKNCPPRFCSRGRISTKPTSDRRSAPDDATATRGGFPATIAGLTYGILKPLISRG